MQIEEWMANPDFSMGSVTVCSVCREVIPEREAALLAVVKRVVAASAGGRMVMCMCGVRIPNTHYDTSPLFIEGGPVEHQPDCIFAQARALLIP